MGKRVGTIGCRMAWCRLGDLSGQAFAASPQKETRKSLYANDLGCTSRHRPFVECRKLSRRQACQVLDRRFVPGAYLGLETGCNGCRNSINRETRKL